MLILSMAARRVVTASVACVSMLIIDSAAQAGPAGVPRIAFSSMRAGGDFHIYLMNANGANVTRVTQSYYGGDGAVLSPDGSRIVFESPRYGYGQLFLVNTDGTNEHRVLNSSFYGQSGTWSPDGTRIAFSHSSNNGNPGGTGSTWLVNADGTGLQLLSPAGVDDWLPDWSPDGTRIAFCSFSGSRGDLWVMNANGSGRLPLVTGTANRSGPRWSPDGSKIAYTLFPVAGVYTSSSIHVMDTSGTGDVALTDTSSINARPTWSPDGSHIAFHSNRSGCFQVYTMKADGTGVQRITWLTSTPGDFCGSWQVVPATPAGVDDDRNRGMSLHVVSPIRTTVPIRFTVAHEVPARLQIFDSNGRLVRTLLAARLLPGEHGAVWDGRNETGGAAAAGVYHCRLASATESRSVKIVFTR